MSVSLRPVHPGKTLSNELEARGISAAVLAMAMRVPANRVSDIARCRRSISPDTALRLGRALGVSAEFWSRLQSNYEIRVAELEHGDRIDAEVARLT